MTTFMAPHILLFTLLSCWGQLSISLFIIYYLLFYYWHFPYSAIYILLFRENYLFIIFY
jgi:hypothetical protein